MLNVERDLGIGQDIYDEPRRGAGLFCNQRSRVLPLERLVIFPVFCRQSIQVLVQGVIASEIRRTGNKKARCECREDEGFKASSKDENEEAINVLHCE